MSSPKSSGKSPPKPLASPLLTLMQLHPLLPSKFPTLSELARTPSVSPPSSNASGLFCTLVGQPEYMLDDLLRDPKKYETGVSELLQSLVSGSKTLQTLSSEEMTLLDRATLDLNRSSSKKPFESSEDSSKLKTPKPSSKASKNEEPKSEDRLPPDLIPDASAIPDWLR